jgi:radical SAM enzyme (TIGR01210 family)
MVTAARALSTYPAEASARDRWILQRRGARNVLDSSTPYLFLCEDERSDLGDVVSVATIFLTNRECPWRCVMCDLWRNTLTTTVSPGAIPAQIDYALARMPASQQIKLYNSGSFFDPAAIPPEDYLAIAERTRSFARLIVEAHPAFVTEKCVRFRDMLPSDGHNLPRLEIAIGLETIDPSVLPRLNKRMSLEQFARAAGFLAAHDIALRVFLLVDPPFVDPAEAMPWLERSIVFAFECGASVVSLIPTRTGNGALDSLRTTGDFVPPRLETLERALDYGVGLGRGRVFADLWDLERFSECALCFEARVARLAQINLTQAPLARVPCACCDAAS